MKLKARNAHAARTERACPGAAPLLGAMLQQRWQAAASFGRTHLCAVSSQGLPKGSVTHVAVTSRLPQCARNSDLNITIESRLKSSCWGKASMTQGGLLPRGKAEGQEGVKGSLDEALDSEQLLSLGRAAAHWH